MARYLLEFETMDGATFQQVFDDPGAVEARLAHPEQAEKPEEAEDSE